MIMLRMMIFILFFSCNAWADLNYLVKSVNSLPTIDGNANDEQWQHAEKIKVQDAIAGHEITFSALHNSDSIVILISFPDKTQNREHKTLIWDKKESYYKTGPKREDTMVLKWAMNPQVRDLTLSSDVPYQADLWFWKSFRTDPKGFADDKNQIYSSIPNNKAQRLRSKNGSLFFLQRKGDSGRSAYQNRILIDKQGDEEAKYSHRQPIGSRADIRAKGKWLDSRWTIEFMRKLDTGYSDDIRLVTGSSVLLGLSRYEIAGRKVDPQLEEPLFGSGDVGQLIQLSLEK
ncbi:MAG: ethylbenzene dehydrogenase-related protein [Gammaproteobacteria bacterium]|nr:ethylbenzene dehydrogenase-related protein [Gammaproteobacteria bacterium]